MERRVLPERTSSSLWVSTWNRHISRLYCHFAIFTISCGYSPLDRSFYDETWVALNWEISLPSEKTHPEFPLWKLGYTPQQVYDLFFPENFRFICNPERPAVCGRFGVPSDRLWRFEFVVRAGEDGDQMSRSENIQKVVFPYITHKGTRYG